MRVTCRHGHFAFFPKYPSEIAEFSDFFGTDRFVRDGEFFTFPFLAGAPRYSLQGKSYLGLPATASYEGRGPWDVLQANGFVYSIQLNKLVPIGSVAIGVNPPQVGYYFLAQTPLIQPGSTNQVGKRIHSYDAEFIAGFNELRVTEFNYV